MVDLGPVNIQITWFLFTRKNRIMIYVIIAILAWLLFGPSSTSSQNYQQTGVPLVPPTGSTGQPISNPPVNRPVPVANPIKPVPTKPVLVATPAPITKPLPTKTTNPLPIPVRSPLVKTVDTSESALPSPVIHPVKGVPVSTIGHLAITSTYTPGGGAFGSGTSLDEKLPIEKR
jgi:hypothetical protein